MMKTNDDVELDILETNELIFHVRVEGTTTRPLSRLIMKDDGVSYCFEGIATSGGNVSFIIPQGILHEGTFKSMVEIIVGNKILIPVRFNSIMKEKISMTSNLIETVQHDVDVKCNVDLMNGKTLKERYSRKKAPIQRMGKP